MFEDEDVLEKLKKRYHQINPLIFNRSVERSKNLSELFDILETIPSKYPIIWNEKEHCWSSTDDIFQKKGMKK